MLDLERSGGEDREPETADDADRRSALPAVGSQGGRAVVDKYGKEHMSALGKKGSRAVVRRYGLRFYSEIAARNKGVKKRREDGPEGAA